jgi:hypothetical protein
MSKKIIMACMAVVALAAFALPASALASKITLEENGVVLNPVGKECGGKPGICIRGTNTDIVSVLTNSNGEPMVECTDVKMTGRLIKNTHEEVAGTIESASFIGTPGITPHTTHCKSNVLGTVTVTTNPATNGLPWCLRSAAAMAADEVQIRGGDCTAAARPIRFIMHTAVGECVYERAEAVKGSITTTPAAAQVSVVGVKFTRVSNFFCPAEGFLDLKMSLYTDTANEEPLSVVAVP